MLKLKLVRFLFLTPVLDHGKAKYVLNFKETVSFILHLLWNLLFVQNKFWVVFYPPEMHMITSTLPNDSIHRYLKNKTFMGFISFPGATKDIILLPKSDQC